MKHIIFPTLSGGEVIINEHFLIIERQASRYLAWENGRKNYWEISETEYEQLKSILIHKDQ